MMLNYGEIEIGSTVAEMKSCYINSPSVKNRNFTCNIGMSILHQGVKEIGKIFVTHGKPLVIHGESIFLNLWL